MTPQARPMAAVRRAERVARVRYAAGILRDAAGYVLIAGAVLVLTVWSHQPTP